MRGKSMFCASCIIISAVAVAGERPFAALSQNEDVRYVLEWTQAQRARKVADQLQLNEEQVQRLRATRGQIDQIKMESEARRKALIAEIESLAASMKAQIESHGSVDEGLQQRLKDVKRDMRQLGDQERLKIRLAATDLRGLLTDDQRMAAKSLRQRDSKPMAQPRQQRRQGGDHGVRAARFLLSDAFLGLYSE